MSEHNVIGIRQRIADMQSSPPVRQVSRLANPTCNNRCDPELLTALHALWSIDRRALAYEIGDRRVDMLRSMLAGRDGDKYCWSDDKKSARIKPYTEAWTELKEQIETKIAEEDAVKPEKANG